ncbi:MAG: GNAT family N-acetyltransferase [Pyrinomonadaceae bacterium]
MNKGELIAPVLLTEAHDCTGFACGKPPLNQYLKKYALKNQESEISRTYVATRDSRVVGYYTLAFGSVSHEEASERIKEDLPQYPIPVILLARLAVDNREKGSGLGKGLLRDAMLRTLQAANIGGLRAMLTHAKDEDAKSFYERFGFEGSPTHPLHLMLSIKVIRANLL